MADSVTFDILLLGLVDPSADGRARFCDAMEHLTGEPAEGFQAKLRQSDEPLFHSLRPDQVRSVLTALDTAGARVELRPHVAAPGKEPPEAEPAAQGAPALFQAEADDFAFADQESRQETRECPKCGARQPVDHEVCADCGAAFVKHDRELLQNMARERQLEGAQTRHAQIHEEWVQKAKKLVEKSPIPDGASQPFQEELRPSEVPFLAMESDQGPVLLTSDRMVALLEDRTASIPYEMIKDVDVGGGFIQKRGRVRLQVTLHTPLASINPTATSMSWQVRNDPPVRKDVIMDWAFARSFICGSCGERDLDYRLEGDLPHARCMHCATDHRLDLVSCQAQPLEPETE